ncbi:MAG: hypothetical protein GY937_20015 [bacterium]|nr:hypothetical protein [bacterium]
MDTNRLLDAAEGKFRLGFFQDLNMRRGNNEIVSDVPSDTRIDSSWNEWIEAYSIELYWLLGSQQYDILRGQQEKRNAMERNPEG